MYFSSFCASKRRILIFGIFFFICQINSLDSNAKTECVIFSDNQCTHYYMEKWFPSHDKAKEACTAFNISHDYFIECWSLIHDPLSGSFYQSGNLKFSNLGTMLPFTMGIFRYGACSNSIQLDEALGCLPEKSAGQPEACTGNPIDVAYGNKYQSEVDFSLSSVQSKLDFHRVYNSVSKGWQYNYLTIVKKYTEVHATNPSQFFDLLTYVAGDGKLSVLRGAYYPMSSPPIHYSFTSDDGTISAQRYLNTQSQTEYKFSFNDGRIEIFNAEGQIIKSVWPDGSSLVYSYASNVMTITDQLGNWIKVTSNASVPSQFTQLESFDGRVWKYIWDGAGRLVSVMYPDATPHTDSDNPVRQYQYEDTRADTTFASFSKLLTGIIDERGVRYATWKYDESGRANFSAHGVVDANGHYADESSIVYNTDGTATVTTFTGYEADGVTPRTRVATYHFIEINGYKKLSHIDGDPSAHCPSDTRSWTYDANGFVDTQVNKNGVITDLDHNALGQEISRTEAVGLPEERSVTTTYDAELRLPVEIVEPLRTITLNYDTSNPATSAGYGKLLTRTETDTSAQQTGSRTWSYSYYPNGLLQAVNGPRTDTHDVTTYAYTSQGFLSSITNALGYGTRILSHTASGLPALIEDPNGIQTTLTYTPRGWLSSSTLGGSSGLTTTYEYDAIGQLIHLSESDGRQLWFGYDAARRLTQVRDSSDPDTGNRIDYVRDLAGNVIDETVTDHSGVLRQRRQAIFDELNRLLGVLGQHDQQYRYQYDAEGNLTQISNVLGHTLTQAYDGLNRLISQTDALNGITHYQWNRQSRLTRITDPRGKITRYYYDGLGNLTGQSSPDSGSTSYEVDSAGNRIAQTNANAQTLQYTYDALNRLSVLVDDAGMETTWDYDNWNHYGIGRLASLTDSDAQGETLHSLTLRYDSVGRLNKQLQRVDNKTRTLTYDYDSQGRLSTLTYPGGQTLSHSYTADGQLHQLSFNGIPIISNIYYVPFQAGSYTATQWTWGNGTANTRPRDTDSRPTKYKVGTVNVSLHYDEADRITDMTGNGWGRDFGFDALGRLTNTQSLNDSQVWSYDANGNRIQQTLNLSQVTTYNLSPTNNHITEITTPDGTQTLTYNASGNLVNDGLITYHYNARQRLDQISKTQSGVTTTANYTINGLGQRVKKVVTITNNTVTPATTTTRTTRFTYDPEGKLIGEYDDSTTPVTVISEYVYLGDQPVAIIKPDGIYYIQADHLGTPRGVLNSAGTLIWKWDSPPFGETLPNEDPDNDGQTFTLNLRFPGQYYDAESGLHYNGFRDYHPKLGRYLQADPIGINRDFSDPVMQVAKRMGMPLNQGSSNKLNHPYAYADNNPIMRIDIFGLENGEVTDYRAWARYNNGDASAFPAEYQTPGDVLSDQYGNLWPGLASQDWKCTLGPIFGPIGNTCFPEKCLTHDQCYESNKCNMSSWGSSVLGGTKICNQCNKDFFK
jgi:RHS repeat-associated protein